MLRTLVHNKITILITAFLMLGLLCGTSVSTAQTNFNQQINYQGKLTTSTGAAVADGTYNMRFWLLTSPSIATTSAVWAESYTGSARVNVQNGLFSVMLGSSTALTGVNFNQTLYLGVEIGATTSSPVWDGEMSPRKVLGAVPAAFEAKNAQTVGGVASSSFLRNDQPGTLATNTTQTLFTITQNGTGDILNVFDTSTEVFTILDGGNIGIGSSTPSRTLTVAGTFFASGTSTLATTTLASTTVTSLTLNNDFITRLLPPHSPTSTPPPSTTKVRPSTSHVRTTRALKPPPPSPVYSRQPTAAPASLPSPKTNSSSVAPATPGPKSLPHLLVSQPLSPP